MGPGVTGLGPHDKRQQYALSLFPTGHPEDRPRDAVGEEAAACRRRGPSPESSQPGPPPGTERHISVVEVTGFTVLCHGRLSRETQAP